MGRRQGDNETSIKRHRWCAIRNTEFFTCSCHAFRLSRAAMRHYGHLDKKKLLTEWEMLDLILHLHEHGVEGYFGPE